VLGTYGRLLGMLDVHMVARGTYDFQFFSDSFAGTSIAENLITLEGSWGGLTISKMPFQMILRAVTNTISFSLPVGGSDTIVQQTIDVQTARAVSLPPSPSVEHDLEIGFGTGIASVTIGDGRRCGRI
jgi:hypothetical protein